MAPTPHEGDCQVLLAGMLEKRGRWRKEWNYRFCVVRKRSIDYFLEPPAVMEEDQSQEVKRGTIPLLHSAVAVEGEPGRPWCISVGGELLSCATQAEQHRWLETIGAAAAALQGEEGGCSTFATNSFSRPRARSGSAVEEPRLVMFAPEAAPRQLHWREPVDVLLPSAASDVIVVVYDSCNGAGNAMCRLSLFEARASDTSFTLQTFGGSPSGLRLGVRVHDTQAAGVLPASGGLLPSMLPGGPTSCLALALACLLAGGTTACGFFVLLAMLLMQLAPSSGGPPARRVTFSAREIASRALKGAAPVPRPPSPRTGGLAAAVAAVERAPEKTPEAAGTASAPLLRAPSGGERPLWVGKWKLDRARSEVYEPVMADMGVSYFIRKAMDAKTSYLTMSMNATHVVILLQMGISAEETIPLDGSWASKAVPPLSKMSGEARWKLTKNSSKELEMFTEFPQGWGTLTDTLTVSEDGNSFSRRIARSESLFITRYFTRVPE